MPARKKSSSRKISRSSTTPSFFTKDLFIFIVIMAIVAMVTYILTYNAITAKFTQQIGAANLNYQNATGK